MATTTAAIETTPIVLKILVLGDAATGKTSIIKQYCHNTFSTEHKTTIGVDFHIRQVTLRNKTVRLQLWDIAGQDRFGVINRVYYKDAVGAMVVFDISKPKTFESVEKWKKELDDKVLLPNGKPLPVLLLGNKCDLETAEADTAQIDAYVQEHGFIGHFDTSAKLNINIDKAALVLADYIINMEDVMKSLDTAKTTYQPGTLPKELKSSKCC